MAGAARPTYARSSRTERRTMAERTRHDTREADARAAEAANDEAFEELLWEIDVTRRRDDVEEERAAAPQPVVAAPAPRPVAAAPAPEPVIPAPSTTPAPAPRAAKAPRREKRPARASARPATPFARTDLSTPWQRIRSHRVVQIVGWVLLVGGTATLVALAVSLR